MAHKHWGHSLHLFLTNPAALADLGAVAVHNVSIFAVMMVVLLAYNRLELVILERPWFNVDLLRAGTLVRTGVVTLIL